MSDSINDGGPVAVQSKPAVGTVEAESILWSSGPGQVIYLHVYIIALIAVVLIIVYAPWPWVGIALVPLAIAGIYAWSAQCTHYELTSERLHKKWGILTRRRGEDIELYRVEDTAPTAPFIYQLYGRGNVEVFSTDLTAGKFTLCATRDHETVRNMIREQTEAMRHAKGVRLAE